MSSSTVHAVSRKPSPTRMVQESTFDGPSDTPSSTEGNAESIVMTHNQPSKILTLRVTRLAAQRAQAALKRVFEGLDADEEPAKRARLDALSVSPAADDAEHQHSDSCLDDAGSSQLTVATESSGDVAEERMQTIITSMANTVAPTKATQKTSATNPAVQRPPPSGKPLVWANGRGALCEALPYFHSHKSSLHTQNVVAQGFLIDREIEDRDYFGAEVIISSVGGGSERNTETGAMVRTKDATESATNYRAFLNAHQKRTLVAVIAGEENPLYPCQPPHCYAVLGYFHVTDIWSERQTAAGKTKGVTMWRIRLEKADLTEPSWWIANGEDADASSSPVREHARAPVTTCTACGVSSKEIFTVGWLCLNYRCEKYFSLPSGAAFNSETLTYTDVFLNERTPFVGEVPSVKPPMPDTAGCHGTERALRGGFVCPDCGCCNRRVYWNRWVCENAECQYANEAAMAPYPKALLQKEHSDFANAMARKRDKWGVNENPLNENSFQEDPFATIYHRGFLRLSQTLNIGGYLVRQYFLPNSDGKILGSFSIFSARPKVNHGRHGSDDLFNILELTDIGLRRNPAAVVGHKLEGYTRHFQQNFGARYKFGVSVQSKGFSEAPDVILRALQRLIWVKKVAVECSNEFIRALGVGAEVSSSALVDGSHDFNELLALGYMEDDKINYHDDGESELGPVVAALSLGSPSTMSFRPKRRTGFQLPTNKDRGREAYREVLEVTMKHGDMMVMVGPEIQKVYEHTVNPHGMRRFSLTARYIDPERMTSQADRDDAAVKGTIPKHAEAFVYDGY